MSLLQEQRAALLSLALAKERESFPDHERCTTTQLYAHMRQMKIHTEVFVLDDLAPFKRWPWVYGPSNEIMQEIGRTHFSDVYSRGTWRLKEKLPQQWAWTTEHCEHWIGPSFYDAALTDAKSDGGNAPFQLAPVVPQQAAHFPPDSDSLLDLALARVRDEVYPDAEAFDVSTEQAADLERRINEAWAAWCKAHDVKLHCFSVDSSRAESWTLVVCEACEDEGCEACDERGIVWRRTPLQSS